MPIKRILWASDGSKESRDALRWAEILANQFGARVIGLSVIETLNRDTLKTPADLRKDIPAHRRCKREEGNNPAYTSSKCS